MTAEQLEQETEALKAKTIDERIMDHGSLVFISIVLARTFSLDPACRVHPWLLLLNVQCGRSRVKQFGVPEAFYAHDHSFILASHRDDDEVVRLGDVGGCGEEKECCVGWLSGG